MAILDEIFAHRPKSVGYNCNRFVELVDGEEVPISSFEPDPTTFRSDYFYHSRLNILYKRIVTTDPISGETVMYWKPLSDLCSQ